MNILDSHISFLNRKRREERSEILKLRDDACNCRLCDVTSTNTPRLYNCIILTARWYGAESSKASQRMGDFSKISAPLSLINTYPKNLISAGSISLNSTFKGQLRQVRWFFYQCNLTRTRESNESMQITNDETCLLFYLFLFYGWKDLPYTCTFKTVWALCRKKEQRSQEMGK